MGRLRVNRARRSWALNARLEPLLSRLSFDPSALCMCLIQEIRTEPFVVFSFLLFNNFFFLFVIGVVNARAVQTQTSMATVK